MAWGRDGGPDGDRKRLKTIFATKAALETEPDALAVGLGHGVDQALERVGLRPAMNGGLGRKGHGRWCHAQPVRRVYQDRSQRPAPGTTVGDNFRHEQSDE